MPAHTKRKYSVLLEKYPKVRRWFKNLERGSPITAKVGMRRLSRLTELLKMDPTEMVQKGRNELDGFQDLLEDMVASLESENKSPGYIADLMKTVRSWLRYNGVTLTRKIKIRNSTATPTIENEKHCVKFSSKQNIKNILLFFYNKKASTTPTKINKDFNLQLS